MPVSAHTLRVDLLRLTRFHHELHFLLCPGCGFGLFSRGQPPAPSAEGGRGQIRTTSTRGQPRGRTSNRGRSSVSLLWCFSPSSVSSLVPLLSGDAPSFLHALLPPPPRVSVVTGARG